MDLLALQLPRKARGIGRQGVRSFLRGSLEVCLASRPCDAKSWPRGFGRKREAPCPNKGLWAILDFSPPVTNPTNRPSPASLSVLNNAVVARSAESSPSLPPSCLLPAERKIDFRQH